MSKTSEIIIAMCKKGTVFGTTALHCQTFVSLNVNATVHIPIDKSVRVLIETGNKINSQTPLYEHIITGKTQVITAANILKIKGAELPKYLKKNIGEKVETGDILVVKKNLFSTYLIKSPIYGTLKEMDLKKGTITITQSEQTDAADKFYSPVDGRIKEITHTYIKVEINGLLIHGEDGKGAESVGKLEYLAGDKIEILDIKGNDLDNVIILCKSLSSDALLKLEVMGAKGLIIEKLHGDSELPWVKVAEEMFKKILSYSSENIWIRPSEKEIIILGKN